MSGVSRRKRKSTNYQTGEKKWEAAGIHGFAEGGPAREVSL